MMDIQEYLKRYFEQLPKKRKIAAQDVKDAVATSGVPPIQALEIILTHAEHQLNIKVEKELDELSAAREAAKTEKSEQKRRTDIKNAVDNKIKDLQDLSGIIETEPDDKISALLFDLFSDIANLAIISSNVNRFPTWADYEAAWQKENEYEFSPELFNRLPFPEGTVSYIGARTGRGKTTVLANIGVEALFPLGKKVKSRNVLFISLEENQKQILRRFSLCLAYRDATHEIKEKLKTVTNPYTGKRDPKNAYKNLMRGNDICDGPGSRQFEEELIKANKKIKEAIGSKKFIFFDGMGASLAEILAALKTMNRGDIVLLDYIQKIPAGKETRSGNPDLERIRDGSAKLVESTKIRECVTIAAAQFNRESYKGSSKKDDEFTDADFRGCGDLEQDGHNLLGIGRNAGKTKNYYGIIKSREGELTDKLYALDFQGGYSYMAYIGETPTPTEKPRSNVKDNSSIKKVSEESTVVGGLKITKGK